MRVRERSMRQRVSSAVLGVLGFALSCGSGIQVAPNISSESVQGPWFELRDFRGQKNVLVVFYRTHA